MSFNLVVKSSNLTKSSHYNTYQHKLYRLIKFLKEERGIGYRRISHILTEKGYRSVRTNSILENNYIHSIYKKGKIREGRGKMSKLRSSNVNVLLFNSKENTPNISKLGFDYPTSFDKHMVCGLWKYNTEKFCYGVDEDGLWINCEEK